MIVDLLTRAGAKLLGKAETAALGAALPESDEELDRLLAQVVEARDDVAFTNLTFAALAAGRRVDGRHLAGGADLLPDCRYLAVAVMNCSGDVAAALLEAVRNDSLCPETEGSALLLAGEWCRLRRSGVFPQDLIAHARMAARRSGGNALLQCQMYALSRNLKDEGLTSILERENASRVRDLARAMKEGLLAVGQGPILDAIADAGILPPTASTIRRAVARVGRNDPCPCGSGQKYKRCCFHKDQERRLEPATAAGRAIEEPEPQVEASLTAEQIRAMRRQRLARLDFRQVAPELRPTLIDQLIIHEEQEALVRYIEELGFSEEVEFHWGYIVSQLARRSRRDLIERLLSLRENPREDEKRFDFTSRMLLAAARSSDPLLALVEEEARRGLGQPNTWNLEEFARDLLASNYPGLGILVARGVIAVAQSVESWETLELLLEARDKLCLAPDDPIESVLEKLDDSSEDDGVDSEAFAKARQRLEAKTKEVRKLRDELAELKKRADRHAEAPPGAPTPQPVPAAVSPSTAPPPEDPALQELRRRMRNLEVDLKERHAERNQLRRDLEHARGEVEALRASQAAPQAATGQDAEGTEDSLLLDEEVQSVQPARVPSYSSRFRESLVGLPDGVVRSALRLIGRLAAGDTEAFHGSRRLKARRELIRQRVGIGHRLLFRLEKETLEVVALVPRGSLERVIRTLGRV